MTRHLLCKVSDIPLRRSRRFKMPDGERIAVFHTQSGFYAVRDVCPHAGASLHDGIVKKNQLMCAWHGWKFDLQSGKCLHEESRLTVFRIDVEGDVLYLHHKSA